MREPAVHEGKTERHTRRYWRRADEAAGGWWPWGWLPLLGLAATFLWGLVSTAPAIENDTRARVEQTLELAGHRGLLVEADGQEVRISGQSAFAAAAAQIESLARGAACDTWLAKDLVCPTSVHVELSPAPALAPVSAPGPAVAAKAAAPPPQRELQLLEAIDRCDELFAGALSASTIRFRSGSAVISRESAGLLQQLAALAKDCPGKLDVEGHTDNIGAEHLNLNLSRVRAEAVVAALVEYGVGSDRLQAKGLGPWQPVADNGTRRGRARNRRIEIRVAALD